MCCLVRCDTKILWSFVVSEERGLTCATIMFHLTPPSAHMERMQLGGGGTSQLQSGGAEGLSSII